MPVTNPGILNRWVTLSDEIVDGTPKTFDPARVKVQLRSSGLSAEERMGWQAVMRYHPQITFNTQITLDDGRQLHVREIDNFGNADRSGYMTVRCYEVQTP